MPKSSLTSIVADYILDVDYDDLPVTVIENVKNIIVDQIGCQLVGSVLPWSRRILSYAEGYYSDGSSTILNYGLKVHPELASLVNGSFGHGFDIDDLSREGEHHPAVGSVTPSIALGEERKVSGSDVILAVYVGWELSSRLGVATQPELMNRGFHMMGTLGTFGSTFSACKILRLQKKEIMNAMGIAGSLASTINQFSMGGGEVKRLHGGIGASSGIRASLLAEKGLTGASEILEGEKGFCNVFAGTPKLDAMMSDVGKTFLINNVCYKVYSSPAPLHGPIEAALEIQRELNIKSEQIKQITVGTSKFVAGHLGSIGPRPMDMLAAQYSMHFNMALTILKQDNSVKAFIDADLGDPRIIELAERVRAVVDPDIDSTWPQVMGGRITIETFSGKVYSRRVDFPKGTAENPLSKQELDHKFFENAKLALGENQCSDALRALRDLDKFESINALTEALISKNRSST